MTRCESKRMRFWSMVLCLAVCAGIMVVGLAGPAGSSEKKGKESDEWTVPDEAEKRENPIPADEESLARGRNLYQQNCAMCHGENGGGDGPLADKMNPKPENLQEEAGHHSDGEVAWKIATGRGPMPAWEDRLTENEIWDLTNFVQSLGGH